MELKAFDKDVGSSDFLGAATPISYTVLVHEEKRKKIEDEEEEEDTWKPEKDWVCDLFNDCKKTGQVKFSTKFIWREPDPPPNPKLNPNCQLRLTIKKAEFLKDADTVGK